MLMTRERHVDHALGEDDAKDDERTTAPSTPLEGLIAQARWLWRCSRQIDGAGKHPWLKRLRLIREGLRYREALRPFQWAPSDSVLGHALHARPQLLELVIRPYQTIAWNADRRLEMLRLHYEQVGRLDWPQLRDPDAVVDIMPLDEVQAGLRLVLDQATWFTYEGPLVINLFLGSERIYSLAFALRNNGEELEACVGAIQGRSLPDIRSTYRELTRASHGLRPRDLLIEMFQSLCEEIGVERITLVSDSHRHHRHAYFGETTEALTTDYDSIWADRGARRLDDAMFELPMLRRRRSAAEITPRKRTQYRRRYDLLDRLSAEAKARIAVHRNGTIATVPRSDTAP